MTTGSGKRTFTDCQLADIRQVMEAFTMHLLCERDVVVLNAEVRINGHELVTVRFDEAARDYLVDV